MSTEAQHRSKKSLLRFLIFVGVVVTGLAVASAVFAGWTTISFTNSAIDTTWGTANYTDANNDPAINDRNEIKNGWVRYDGTNIYFRVETVASKILSATNIRLVGALDCNHDGDFIDPMEAGGGPGGDRLVVYAPDNTVTLYDGAFTGVGPVSGDFTDPPYSTAPASLTSIEWGVPMYMLPPVCRGSASPINVGWATGTGAGSIIDQSKTSTELSNPMDYGDTVQTLPPPPATCSAPDTATGLQCNGARHGIVPMTPSVPLRFGSEAVDADAGNLQSANSDADDTNGTTPDDEAGIAPTAGNSWSDGSGQISFTVSGGTNVRVSCWVDFNKNGVWTDTVNGTSEKVLNNLSITNAGATITRPATAPSGLTWGGGNSNFPARCRIYPDTVTTADPFGPIEFGEVEDHIWEFDASGNYVSGCVAPSAPSGLGITKQNATTINLAWTPGSGATQYEVWTGSNAPYFDPSAKTCASPAPYECTVRTTTDYSAPDLGDAAVNHSYVVRSGNGCGVSAVAGRVGEFDFGLTPGTP